MRYPIELEQFVRDYCNTYNNEDLAKLVNEKFALNMSRKLMKCYLSNHHITREIKVPYGNHELKVYSEAEVEYVKENYKGVGPSEMVERLYEKFGNKYRRNQIKGLYRRLGLDSGLTGKFEKGHIPWSKGTKGLYPKTKYNSGWFKKGESPSRCEIGSVKKRYDGYWIKTAEPNVWTQYHRVVYEQCFGEIPENMNVIFKDHNKFNCNPDNLLLVSKAEHQILNTLGYRSTDPEITDAGLKIVKIREIIKKGAKR